MSVQFICGGSGTGKTQWCINKIKEHRDSGFYTVMVVPEQTSLSVENRLISALSFLSSEQDVLSFARLLHRVCKEVCGGRRESLDATGRAMLISKILLGSESRLQVFGGKINSSGDMLTTISEFIRYGISPADISTGAGGSDLLTGKLSDIAFIYSEYIGELEKSGAESEDNAALFSSIAENSSYLKNSYIFIDGFSTFTPAEISMISTLDKVCKGVYVTLKTDLSRSMLFSPADDMKYRISQCVTHVSDDILLKNNFKHKGAMLFFEQNYARFNKKHFEEQCDEIEILLCESPVHEVDACARDILRKIREYGYSYKDIAVITGNADEYIPLVRRSFELHGIQFFADYKSDCASHPLCDLILSLCEIFISGFSFDAVFRFLKTGFTDLDDSCIDILENYVLETGISGSKWNEAWSYKEDKYDLSSLNSCREYILSLILPFREATKGKTRAGDYTQAIFDFMNRAGVPEKVEKISSVLIESGRKQDASEYRQIYNKLARLFLQLELSMGEYTFGISKFYDILNAGIAQIKTAPLPPEQDSVTVGEYERTRPGSIKLLYILGANDGIFPPVSSGTGIISDSERRAFEKNGIELAPDSKRKALEAPFKMYDTLTSASERLVICRSISSSVSAALRPSRIISELERLFDKLKYTDFISAPDISYVSTPRATLRQLFSHDRSKLWSEVEAYLAQDNELSGIISHAASASELSLSSVLREEVALALWGKQLRTTITRLETFAKCPFRFFATYGLSLREREIYDFAPIDSGNFVHKILEDFINKTISEGNVWSDITFDDCKKTAEELSENAFTDIMQKLPLLTNRHRFLINRLKKSAADALWAVTNHIKKGVFRPFAAELELSDDGIVPPYRMTTPAGNALILYGKVDRIDTDGVSFRIIDYKSSAHDIDLSEVYNGVSLQLFVYSAAVRDKLGKPSGMFYLTVNTPLIEFCGDKTSAEIENEIAKAFRLAGYMVGNTDTVLKMDENISGWSDVVSARLTQKGIQTSRLMNDGQYSSLEKSVLKRVGEMGDMIMSGECSVSPLLQSHGSACSYCPYSCVCGFEEAGHEYRHNESYTSEEIFSLTDAENA